MDIRNADGGGVIPGRVVSISAKVYRQAFGGAPIKLGQCPLVMEDGNYKLCKDEFEGEAVYIAKGATTVDVTKADSTEDIVQHIMGGVGASIGVLGLISVSPKVKVAVDTETSRKALNLMSSYEINKGVMTLHNPRVKHVEGKDALFLSEIELGGNELILVTLEFESEAQKTQVEVSVTFKILFISITAKLEYVHKTMKTKASCRVQFQSSWRETLDVYYSDLGLCIPKVKEIEDMYMRGPREIRDMSPDEESSHTLYHFSSWNGSPYGTQFNLALINHDLEFLTEQNTEIKAVLQRINKLKVQSWPADVRKKVVEFNATLTEMTGKLTAGLDNYHNLQPKERLELRDIYGQRKAPQYYSRNLDRIIA